MSYKFKDKLLHGIVPALLIHLSIGSVYAWSVFTNPLMSKMNLTLSQTQFTFGLAIFFLGMSSTVFGKFVEKDVNKSAVLSGLFFSVGMITTGYAINIDSLSLLYIGYGCLVGIGLGIGYITPVKTLTMWFPNNKGFATGIAIMGFGFAGAIASPIIVYLIDRLSIELTFTIMGFIYGLLIFLASVLIKKPYIEDYKQDSLISIKELVSKKEFWLVWFIIYINILCGLVLISMASPLLQNVGIGITTASIIVSIMSIFNGLGRIGFATLSDGFNNRSYGYLIILSLSIFFVIDGVIFENDSIIKVTLPIILIIVSACYGGGFSMLPAWLSDVYGNRNLSMVHGCVLSAWGIAGLSSSLLIALLGSEVGLIFSVLGSLYLVGLLLVLLFIKNTK